MASGGITTVVTPVAAKGEREWKCGCHRMTASPLRGGDGVADVAEGVVAAVAAAGGDDEVVFAARDWIVEDDFGGDGVAFEVLRQGVNANWRQYSV